MKRQMKIAAVVSATALLAIGASFTSMAAAKTGTWKNEEGTWYCYDKDGDPYENEFCLDNGEEFFVGDDGAIVYNSWVEKDGAIYYINSRGQASKNEWKFLTPIDDEDADAEWFRFGSNGKLVTSKKLPIAGETYYFENDGSVLYGWVDPDNFTNATSIGGSTVFCDDETGARVSKAWVETKVPNAADDDENTYWYYIKNNSQAQTGMAKSISGQTYFFGADGKMLDGWITASGSDYVAIDGSKQTTELSVYVAEGKDIYFACTEDGHVKKNKWIYEWKNTEMAAADSDNAQYYYYVQKDGKVYVPKTASAANAVSFDDYEVRSSLKTGDSLSVSIKKVNDKFYAFDTNGIMKTGLINVTGAGLYYFDNETGAMKTGSVTLTDEYGTEGKFLFSTATADKGIGVTGAKNGKLYENGLLITAKDAKYALVKVNGEEYIVNRSGSIQTTQKVYKDDETVICDATNAKFESTGSTKGSVTSWK